MCPAPPAGKILLHGAQYWMRSLDTGTGNVAEVSIMGGDESQPVNITASTLMAVASPELQFLLHQSGCFCQTPVISIPSTTRSTLELVKQVLCHGQADLVIGQDAKRSCSGVKDVMELIAPGVIIDNMVMSCKVEEDDDSGLSILVEVEAGDEVVNIVKDHDYTTKVDDSVLGKKKQAKKVKSHMNEDVWKSIIEDHKKKVGMLNLSVMDCGLIRSKYSPREVRELVPRKIKKESDDPEDKIACELCGKTFTTAPSVCSHMVTHSPSRDDVLCPVCGFSAEFHKLVNHVRSMHLKEKVYNCTTCQAKFSTHSAKSSHMRKHSRSDTMGQCENNSCRKFYKKASGRGCTSCSKK